MKSFISGFVKSWKSENFRQMIKEQQKYHQFLYMCSTKYPIVYYKYYTSNLIGLTIKTTKWFIRKIFINRFFIICKDDTMKTSDHITITLIAWP